MIKASLLLACETLVFLSGNFGCCWRRDRAGEEKNQLMGRTFCFGDRLFLCRQTGWEPESKGEKQLEDGCQHCQSCTGPWQLVPIPLGSDGTHSFWDHGWTVQHQKQSPNRESSASAMLCVVCICTPVLQWCGCWSHCSALSVHLCAPCYAGLSHAAAADQILAIPTYFILAATPAQDWRWIWVFPRLFQLLGLEWQCKGANLHHIEIIWGWQADHRQSFHGQSAETLSMHSMSLPCSKQPCQGETWNQCLQDTANMCITFPSNEKISYLEWTWACICPTHCLPSPHLHLQTK